MLAKNSLRLTRKLFIDAREGSIEDHYIFTKILGKGGFATVWEITSKLNKNSKRAVKVITKARIENCPYLQNQFRILTILDHPSIVKIYETFQDEINLYIVMDLCKGGDFLEYLNQHPKISEQAVRLLFIQMVQIVQYCHNNNIAHRDLKPENFLILTNNSLIIKLIDFGMAFQWEQNMEEELKIIKKHKKVGTIYYVAPQVLTKDFYDQRCDIWSLGIILYMMATASHPFTGKYNHEIIHAITKCQYSRQNKELKKLSFQLRDLIERILMPADKRISLQQIINHNWMKCSNINNESLKLNYGRMKHFKKYTKFKKIAVSCISSQLPDIEIMKLAEQFKKIDKNNDGYLQLQQFQQCLVKEYPHVSLQQIRSTIKQIDLDSNGKINYLEFITSCLENFVIFQRENILRAFRILDKNNDGKVSAEQLRNLLLKEEEFHKHIDQKQVYEIMKFSDKNKDGIIDFEEFQKALSER